MKERYKFILAFVPMWTIGFACEFFHVGTVETFLLGAATVLFAFYIYLFR